jgi:hypothetical protein
MRAAALPPPDGVTVRAPAASDPCRLGQLCYDWHVPGANLATVAAAIADTRTFCRGEFGPFCHQAGGIPETAGSPVVVLSRSTGHRETTFPIACS